MPAGCATAPTTRRSGFNMLTQAIKSLVHRLLAAFGYRIERLKQWIDSINSAAARPIILACAGVCTENLIRRAESQARQYW